MNERTRKLIFGLMAWLGIPVGFVGFSKAFFSIEDNFHRLLSIVLFVGVGTFLLTKSVSRKPAAIVFIIIYCVGMLLLLSVIQGVVACFSGDCF